MRYMRGPDFEELIDSMVDSIRPLEENERKAYKRVLGSHFGRQAAASKRKKAPS